MPTQQNSQDAAKPFPCPDCGANEWRAWYPEYASQSVILAVDDDGRPYADDYTGDYEGADVTFENESYECLVCGHEITMGSYEWVPRAQPVHTSKATDEQLVEILRQRAAEKEQ